MNKVKQLYYLSWLCAYTGRKFRAGIAYFLDDKGEYRLRLDAYAADRPLYLKAVGMNGDLIKYRLEACYRGNNGKHRDCVGTGQTIAGDKQPIYINMGPGFRTLVMEQAN